jgi:hypothetical protein
LLIYYLSTAALEYYSGMGHQLFSYFVAIFYVIIIVEQSNGWDAVTLLIIINGNFNSGSNFIKVFLVFCNWKCKYTFALLL